MSHMDDFVFPTSWDDLDMDWDNPDPYQAKYWVALQLAINERWDLAYAPGYVSNPTTNTIYFVPDRMASYTYAKGLSDNFRTTIVTKFVDISDSGGDWSGKTTEGDVAPAWTLAKLLSYMDEPYIVPLANGYDQSAFLRQQKRMLDLCCWKKFTATAALWYSGWGTTPGTNITAAFGSSRDRWGGIFSHVAGGHYSYSSTDPDIYNNDVWGWAKSLIEAHFRYYKSFVMTAYGYTESLYADSDGDYRIVVYNRELDNPDPDQSLAYSVNGGSNTVIADGVYEVDLTLSAGDYVGLRGWGIWADLHKKFPDKWITSSSVDDKGRSPKTELCRLSYTREPSGDPWSKAASIYFTDYKQYVDAKIVGAWASRYAFNVTPYIYMSAASNTNFGTVPWQDAGFTSSQYTKVDPIIVAKDSDPDTEILARIFPDPPYPSSGPTDPNSDASFSGGYPFNNVYIMQMDVDNGFRFQVPSA